MYDKSIPSEPASDIITTFIFSPLILFLLIKAFISVSLLDEPDNKLSPLIKAYVALFFTFVFLNVNASICFVGLTRNKLSFPYLENPISSSANANGKHPPSMYCE